ncbi:hypothetical protein BN1222_04880 [Klebsiella quasipneumoniae]|uniref:hypothetical protein n=1 Tax=Klebsiella quasipneumoniae TaxID=1463165 RepID=UPI0005DF8CAC|nr:hypothetical protein BN1222_04880 [Klebsiella quasipneumoniae]
MTITLQAVNELIQSLESAGELSIRKQKFLKLAKAFKQLAEENAALKKFCKNAAFDADYEAELGMEMGGFTDALNNIETPATDALLTELRNEAGARAVELFAKTLCSPYSFRDEKCYEDGFTRAIEIVRDAQAPRFAKKLREGAK